MKKRVVVVGAGVIGLFCALRLAQRGAQVSVLEAENEDDQSAFSANASLAAAGMLAPLSPTHRADEHPEFASLALASFDLWRAFSKEAPWRDGIAFAGGVYHFLAADAAEGLVRRATALGREAQLISASHWRKRTGFRTEVQHAVFVSDEGVADPAQVMSSLRMEARRLGVDLRFGHDVDAVEANAVAVFEHGRIEADAVVLAPGAWASERLAAAAPALQRLRPARGHVVPVRCAASLAANLHGEDFYLAPRGSGAVLGSTMEFDTHRRHVDPDQVEGLLGAVERVLPGEVARDPARRPWVGVRPMSPDWAPMIGPSGAALVACGHSRDGWLLAPITAEIVCAHAFADPLPALWAAFRPDRFEAQ